MTRINVVPVEELSDLHLKAEYRELPRVIKQYKSPEDAFNEEYKLGKGHILWARKYSYFCLLRYKELCNEMQHRGITVNFPYSGIKQLYFENIVMTNGISLGYVPTRAAIEINKTRLIERIGDNKNVHKWTNRKKPEYL